MKKAMHWYDHITLNIYWLGLNVSAGVITPVLLPYLVALFVPDESKNTYLATVRVIGLAMAMMFQPIAGLLSDRCTSRLGRRRPFIIGGTLFDLLFLLIIGAAPLFLGSQFDTTIEPIFGFNTAYAVLLAGLVLLQISSNFTQGPLQALIPDLVPEDQRGRSSGFKAVLELLPTFFVILIGPLVDAGRIWLTVGIIGGALTLTMLITVFTVREQPLESKPQDAIAGRVLRLIALTVIFIAVTRGAIWLTQSAGSWLTGRGAGVALQIIVVGAAGLVGMAGSILLGVYFGAWVGIGREARSQNGFIWWVVNRLLFLSAVGSIQGFALYFLRDALLLENAATKTTIMMAVVGLFLLPSAIGGGYLADRMPRKRIVAYSGIIAAAGTLLLLLSQNFAMVIFSGCIIGTGAGVFMATNWALGTDLVPPKEAGRYLGISNLAGAGAGIVGAGIGGPMADFFNNLQPGLGYSVIFAIYGALFLLSVALLVRVPEGSRSAAATP